MSLSSELHRLIPDPCFDRPFVCDGPPESCDVMVIGENPATKMGTDWWSFWDDEKGFDLGKFERAYEEARLAVGKRAISNTRLRLRRLRSHGLRCLETNLFKNERLGGHGDGISSSELLPVLVEHLPRLRAVIAHGAIAGEYLDKLALPIGIRMRHFRSESYENIDSVAKQILAT